MLATELLTANVALAQPMPPQEKVVVQVDDTTVQVVGIPQEYKAKDWLAPGWVVALEARDKSGKLVSRANVAVTGCEPNQLGPKLGRMFILNGKTNYWTPSGDRVFDLLAKAVCAARPKPLPEKQKKGETKNR
ncbi:MAG: hypothetical protein JNM52_02435 [Betaproteobacteria bacterium]|nr:hypothetical protein [Betaproteobacteria bacterium]